MKNKTKPTPEQISVCLNQLLDGQNLEVLQASLKEIKYGKVLLPWKQTKASCWRPSFFNPQAFRVSQFYNKNNYRVYSVNELRLDGKFYQAYQEIIQAPDYRSTVLHFLSRQFASLQEVQQLCDSVLRQMGHILL